MGIIELNKDNFKKEVLENKKGILVDFFATWCGPCKMMCPLLEDLAKKDNKFDIGKLDVDECEDLAREYGIMSIPCIIYFKDGKEVNRSVGMASEDDLLKMTEE